MDEQRAVALRIVATPQFALMDSNLISLYYLFYERDSKIVILYHPKNRYRLVSE